jgi:hypothetical protein
MRPFGQVIQFRWLWILGSFLLLGLGHMDAQGRYSPVTEADVVKLQFNHYFTPDNKGHDPDFEWTFTEKEFVLKKGKGAIPKDLLEKLLPKDVTADEIRGKWKLEAENGKLVFSDIKAAEKEGNKDVKFRIYRTAPTVIRIGEPQYVFGVK